MYIATAREMQNIDSRARDEYGIPTLLLMENAALGIIHIVEDVIGAVRNKRITIVSGKGNNGGDGIAAARQLHNRGARVQVYLLSEPAALKGDAATNLGIALKMGIDIQSKGMYDMQGLRIVLNHSNVIIDAIFGTGLSAHVKGEEKEIIELINSCNQPRVSVDIPSGINSDTGEVMGAAIKADTTVTFGIPKRGHILYPGCEFTGKLHIADISIPEAAVKKESIYLHLLTEDDMRGLISPRPADSHKGSFGHVLVIAGSIGKSGAGAMTSLAGLRTGAGLLTLATPESVQHIVAEKLTEVMTCPLAETGEKTIASSAAEKILGLSEDKEVIAIGPGLTTHKDTAALVRRLIKDTEVPIIIDADALNALSDHTEILKERRYPAILTPHPGEMGRLTGKSTAEVQKDRIGVSRGFATEYGVYLILKGAHTVIAEPSGEVYLSPTGNPGMATAGTGDALTGILAGLISQGIDVASAARLGVYLHGLAGDIAAEEVGMIGMLAGDLINRIPAAIRKLNRESL
jgi:NAD(P)H-hydrate epimerase